LVNCQKMSTEGVQLANIGPRGRRRRLLAGLVLLSAGLVVMVLHLTAASRWWLVAVFGLIWAGILNVLQARGHTCVALAAGGKRDMDSGPEPVSNPEEAAALRRRALIMVGRATVIAALMTLIASVSPLH
jgi:hypothetical protein